MRHPRPHLALGFALLALACSKTPNDSKGTSNGAGGEVGGMGGVGGVGGVVGMGGMGGAPCSVQDNEAEVVTLNQVAMKMPDPVGGAIREDTYHLTAFTQYTGDMGMEGPTGSTWHETAIWTNTEVRTVLERNDGAGPLRLMFAYDLGDGTGDITMSTLCPESLSVPWDAYTADVDSLKLYSTQMSFEWVYTPQNAN